MLFIILCIVLTAVFFGLGIWLINDHEFCSGLCIFAGLFGVITLVIMIFCAVDSVVGLNGKIAKNQQQYNSLVYQLEHNLYDNDNDLGKKELYDQIQDWNEDLAEGKALQRDIWVGAFYPNIYDEFDFIELK